MHPDQLIPAAQYLRMSTEHQQYSMQNQAAAIQQNAEFNGFEIVRTYADPARSGVVLKRRIGLQQLLQDVIAGTTEFRAILVFDVSRWGRFQDSDEAAQFCFLRSHQPFLSDSERSRPTLSRVEPILSAIS